mgnify:CR=1 FL=1
MPADTFNQSDDQILQEILNKATPKKPSKTASSKVKPNLKTKKTSADVVIDLPDDSAVLIPSTPANFRPMTSPLAVSSLFTSFKPRSKKSSFIKEKKIGKYASFDVYYMSGDRLDYRDEEIVMAIFNLYSKRQATVANNRINVTTSFLLQYLKRKKGGTNSVWLHERLEVLAQSLFSLKSTDLNVNEDQGQYKLFHIFESVSFNNGQICIELDKTWQRIFSNFPVTLVYTPVRLHLKSGHARVIHRLLSTCSTNSIHEITEEKLIQYLGWEGTRRRDFWLAITTAAEELVGKGVISSYQILPSTMGQPKIRFHINLAALKPGLLPNKN